MRCARARQSLLWHRLSLFLMGMGRGARPLKAEAATACEYFRNISSSVFFGDSLPIPDLKMERGTLAPQGETPYL
jgi:hypothetical protein